MLTAVATCTTISSIWVYHDAAHEVEELFDASLAQAARVLHGMITRQNISENKEHLLESLDNKDEDFDRYSYEATPHGHKYEKKVSFQVWGVEKDLLLHSASAGKEPLADLERGFSQIQTTEGHWRTFTLFSTHDNYWLIVAERDDIRAELTHDIARDHMLPVILFLPILGFLVWFTVGRGMHPLRKIADQVASQEYEELSEIKQTKIPHEVKGLLSSINNLFHRLNQSYRREQQFVSNAAHELRNPLAGVQIHADNLLTELESGAAEAELREPIKQIQRSNKRLSRLVSQLLILSRTDSDQYTNDEVEIDVGLLAEDICHELVTLANEKNIQCNIPLNTFKLRGNSNLLESLLRNLIDNALRYSPTGSRVLVHCKQDDNTIDLVVEDSGPGIDKQERKKVLDRFYRVKAVNTEGSGLGLAIVSRIASLHAATIVLDRSELGGLLVSIAFPKVTKS